MKCSSCGENVANTAKFCENCGVRLAVPAPEPITETVIAEPIIEPSVEPAVGPITEPSIEPTADTAVASKTPETSAPITPNVTPDDKHTAEEAQAPEKVSNEPKADASREQAYLNYQKKLHQMRQHQTAASVAAVPVAATAEPPVSVEEKPPVTVSEEPSSAVSAEIIPPQPNAVVVAGKSGLFGAANVLFTINTVLSALFTVGAVLLGAGGAIAAIAALSEFIGIDISGFIDAAVGETIGIAVLIGVAAAILANLPGVLVNIGLCSTRSACMRSNGENIRPTGLKLIRFVTVAGIVFTALLCVALFCVSILFAIGDPHTKAMGITLLIFTILAVIATVFCFAKLLDSLNKAIGTAKGCYEKQASTFLGVLCIIAAVFSLLNPISCLALIFYAVTLFKYNSIVGSRNAQ